ncbi:hypothetical protein K0M31_010559, partial [Melipona bicolor]
QSLKLIAKNKRGSVFNNRNNRCDTGYGRVATPDEILQQAGDSLITGVLQMILEFIEDRYREIVSRSYVHLPTSNGRREERTRPYARSDKLTTLLALRVQ